MSDTNHVMPVSREIHLARRPEGVPNADDFKLKEVTLRALSEGEVLVKNTWMSVDPYMRGRMNGVKTYIDPFNLDEALSGGAIGEVIASTHAVFSVGDKVSSMSGWREYFISQGEDIQKLPETSVPEQAFLGVLGMPGMTAYTGLLTVGELKEGDTVFVSAASGAVGSLVCQLAKLKGCYVAGSVGSDEKARYLRDVLNVDVVVNYKTCGSLQEAVAEACPQGIDVYFENVGGKHLEAVLEKMKEHGRIAVCGLISQYNAIAPVAGPNNLANILIKRLKIQGFIVFEYWDHYPAFVVEMTQWIQQKKISWKETVADGIENAPEALMGLFSGKNVGKMLVKL